jgi:peptide/nickel transport system ATP-binding protein
VSEALVATPPSGGAVPAEPEPAPTIAETPVVTAAPPPAAGEVVLDVQDLRTYFFTYAGVVRALDGVTFQLRRGETTGLVGETGCGKSVTAFSIVRLIPDPPGRIVRGHVLFRGVDLLRGLDDEAKYRPIPGTKRVKVSRRFHRILRANERMEAIRGRRISMIFQEPTQALNPVFSIANQVGEIAFLHSGAEVLDEMLGATPTSPAIGPAVEGVLLSSAAKRPEEMRQAARALGEAARAPRLATEAFYIARTAVSPAIARRELAQAIGRLQLDGLQRQYLHHRRRLYDLRERINRVHLAEIARGAAEKSSLSSLRLRVTLERLAHFYFGIWGLRRWVRRPLDQALFWRVVKILETVQIANPVLVARGYPHELSGGMLQRVMIAMALSANPEILIADEPTTALDVTIQAQILELMRDLRQRVGSAVLLITHDLAVIAEVADRVCVMYAGQIVEEARVADLFRNPLHPYSQGLLASIPRVDQPEKQLHTIPGSVPNLIDPPSGCRFHPRCPFAMPICRERRPPTTVEGADHTVACYLYKGPKLGG